MANPFLAPPEPADPSRSRLLHDILRNAREQAETDPLAGHTLEVFARNWANDPLRTDVLDYLHETRKLVSAVEGMPKGRQSLILEKTATPAVVAAIDLVASHAEQQLNLLMALRERHPNHGAEISQLIKETTIDEIQAYGQAMRDHDDVPEVWQTNKEALAALVNLNYRRQLKQLVRDEFAGDTPLPHSRVESPSIHSIEPAPRPTSPDDRTFVDRVVAEGMPTTDDYRRLKVIAAQERATVRGGRTSAGSTSNHYDLLPTNIRSRGGGTVGRFFKMKAADPLRTDVLCYLAARDTLRWLRQHPPPDRLSEMSEQGTYGSQVRADTVSSTLDEHAGTEHEILERLLQLHPHDGQQVGKLLQTISHEEVQAFRETLKFQLGEFPIFPSS